MKAFDLKANKTENPIAECSLPLGSTATLAALPAMSLTPVAPFARGYAVMHGKSKVRFHSS